jgi:tetratricopeptide (TPR) repeat protein
VATYYTKIVEAGLRNNAMPAPEMTTVADPPEMLSPAEPPSGKAPALTGPLSRWRAIHLPDQHLIVLLILLAVLCYGNSLFNAFVYDDEQQILQNPYVKSWHYLPQIFTTTVWSFVGAAGTTNYYRPLMTFTYLLLWQAFKDIPFGFHLFNITLNAAVVVLVFAAGLRLFRDRRVAWLAAALFAIHPVHTEVVDWIAAVPELEVTFFVLLTFWFFTQLDKSSWKYQAATVTSFALAVLCKEPALMFAPLAIAFEHFVRPDNHSTSLVAKMKRYAPLCVMAATYLTLRVALFGKLAPVLQHPKITWPQTIYSAFALVAGYTKYLFWPAPLSAFHVFHASVTPWGFPVLAGISIFVAAVALTFYWCKRAPAAAFCILWMGITIAPVLNARWMATNVFTERYLYLPSVGFCWLVAWYTVRIWDRSDSSPAGSRKLLVAAAVVIALVSVPTVIRRNGIWRDDVTLYSRTLQTDPDAAIIRSNLAGFYFQNGDLARAEQEWLTALAGKPDNVVTMNALGLLYTRLDRNENAEAMFEQAIEAKPLWGDSHYSRALLLQKTGHLGEALSEFKTAVTLSPLSAPAHRWYGEALLQNGQREDAVEQLQLSVELDQTLEAMHDLSEVYILLGRNADAEPVIRRIIAQYPYDSSAHLILGNLLEQADKQAEAADEFRAVLGNDPNNADAKAALQRLKP